MIKAAIILTGLLTAVAVGFFGLVRMRFAIGLVMACMALNLFGCVRTPISTQPTDNPELQLATLFTHDGCIVYQFYDSGHFHYWADCRGTVMSIQSCGKNCYHEEEVPTK